MAMFSEVAVAQHNSQCDYLGDIDQDDDGLIEICNVEGLEEMRYQLDGTGYTTSTSAMKITDGCPSGGCMGYELTRSLGLLEKYRHRTNPTACVISPVWISWMTKETTLIHRYQWS